MRRVTTMMMVLLLAVAAVACGNDDDSGGSGSGSGSESGSGSGSAPAEESAPKFTEAEAKTVVKVEATEYKFTLTPAQAAGPKVFFEVKNAGGEKHEFEILGADGKTVDEIEEFDAGLTKTLAVELSPATYTIQCILETNGKSHADQGMKTTYTVT